VPFGHHHAGDLGTFQGEKDFSRCSNLATSPYKSGRWFRKGRGISGSQEGIVELNLVSVGLAMMPRVPIPKPTLDTWPSRRETSSFLRCGEVLRGPCRTAVQSTATLLTGILADVCRGESRPIRVFLLSQPPRTVWAETAGTDYLNEVNAALLVDRVRCVPLRTALTLRDSQGRCVKFVVHLLFREFLGREIAGAFNRDRIFVERQFERPGAVFVVGVLDVGGDCAVADVHGVDIIKISRTTPSGPHRRIMRIILRIVATLLIVIGCIWLLQGVNVLPGSFMTGPNPMGGVRCDCDGGRNWAAVRREQTDAEGLGRVCHGYLAKQCRGRLVQNREIIAASLLRQRACQPSFPDAGSSSGLA